MAETLRNFDFRRKYGQIQTVFQTLEFSNCSPAAELTPSILGYNFYTMEFEFDAGKSAANKKKHGIDFVRAQALWDDPDVIEIPARTSDESRSVVIGRIGSRHWSAIITYRDDCIRIISVRRSRKEEVSIHEG